MIKTKDNDFLVVTDVQVDFVSGSLGSQEAVKKVPALIDFVKEFNGNIVCTQDTHFNNENCHFKNITIDNSIMFTNRVNLPYEKTLEGKLLPVEHTQLNTKGWELVDELKEALENKRYLKILKPTFGSFELCHYANLFMTEDSNIYFVGFCTDICVISNALLMRAAFPNNRIIILEDCCAGTSTEAHNAALTVAKSCQIEVI